MTAINRLVTLSSIVAVLVFSQLFLLCFLAQAQTKTTFGPAESFGIPELNGNISFAVNGTYAEASLEKGAWNFVNLRLNGSEPLAHLRVSATNSSVTITECQAFNAVPSGTTIRALVLTYNVVGRGVQTFDFGLNSTPGEWSVTFNGNFVGENEGWTISPNRALTITAATRNVTMVYFNLPDSFGNSKASSQPFYQQHSVAIATAVVVASVVVLVVAIANRRKAEA